MHFSAETKRVLWVECLLTALLATVIVGLFLTYRTGRSATLYWVLLAGGLFLTPRGWLRDIKAVCLQWWGLDRRDTRRLLLAVFAAALAFNLAAHGFLFTNEFFSHDSVTMVYYDNAAHTELYFYITVGRPLLSLYDTLKGPAAAPWLTGLLFIVWTALASVLTVRLLGLQGSAAVLACGLLCTNSAFIYTGGTYVYCLDDYALALLAAVTAAWLFCRCTHGRLLGIVCLVVSLSLYQAYFATGAVLCFLSLLPAVLDGEEPRRIVRKGLEYLALLAVGFAVYSFLWSALCQLAERERLRVDETLLSVGPAAILKKIAEAYRDFFCFLLTGNALMGRLIQAAGLLLLALLLLWLMGWLTDKRLPRGNKALLALAFCLLPAVFNVPYILFLGQGQSLTNCTRGFTGVFLLFCATRRPAFSLARRYRAAAMLLALALVWQNAVTANQLYIKRELDKTSTVSLVTRIIERVEQMDGYIPGETPVAFFGMLTQNEFLSHVQTGYDWAAGYHTGAAPYNYAASYNIVAYITRYLRYPMNIASVSSGLKEIQAMPAFPLDGSIQWVDGMVVVKLS